MLSWASETVPPQRPDETRTTVEAHHFGHAAVIPSVPLPPVNPPGPPREAYPLQSELSQNHRVLHAHIFKEVIPPPQSGLGSPLMATEVDQYGAERNRQAEELLVMSVPTMVDTSIAGPRPPDSPITGVVITTFPKYMMKIPRGPHRGKIATDRLTMLTTPLEPMVNSQNPKWKTTLQ